MISAMVCIFLNAGSVFASNIDYTDFSGSYGMNHDGWEGELELEATLGNYIEQMASVHGTYTGQDNIEHDVTGYVRTPAYMLPESWGPDHKISFYIDFMDTYMAQEDDQQFDGYLFTRTRDAMAGVTWWNNVPYGFYLNKDGFNISEVTSGNTGGFQLADFTGTYEMDHDGWKGTLELEAGTGDYIEQLPNIVGTYTAESGEQHDVRGFIRTSSYPLPQEFGPDHKIELYIDFNDTYSQDDDQKFEGYLFTQSRNAIAGITWWGSTPFGFYCVKMNVDGNDEASCIEIDESLTLHVPCMQYMEEVSGAIMHLAQNPVNIYVPIWKVEFQGRGYEFPFGFQDRVMSFRGESGCLNGNAELEKEDVLFIPCAVYGNVNLSFEMIRFYHPEDPEGLYLELDVRSIRQL